jgi:hypothetical protein
MRGFTLIETIVYIALLGFLMTGVLMSVYGIVESGSITQAKTSTQDEGNFVLRKIEWALGSAESASVSGSYLSIVRTDGATADFRFSGGNIEMRVDGGSYERLTSDAVEISGLEFDAISGTPSGITASTTLDGVAFTTTRYVRP